MINLPVYDNDCECLHICDALGGHYDKCLKGADVIANPRCSIETRQLLLQRDAHTPSRLSRVISNIERVTLWLVAVAGLVLGIVLALTN